MTRAASLFAAVLAAGLVPAAAAQTVVVKAARLHTMAGAAIENGVVVVTDGKITAVGPAAGVAIPEGVRVLEAAVVTPGLIDAHSVIGLAGHLNQSQDQDQLDTSEPVQPELRAIDAYDARERLVGWVRSLGVTTIHTGHAPGQVISGQTLIAKTRGGTVDEAVIVPCAMIAATLGADAVTERRGDADRGGRGGGPGTRAKAVALLRRELVKAAEYARKRTAEDETKRPARDLRLDALCRVLDGEVPLLVTAHRHHDLQTALRLREEFGFRLVLDGAAEAPLVLDEIRAAGVAVILHPTMMRNQGERHAAAFDTAARLAAAGVPFALQSGYESYVPKTRVVLFEAAVAAANGLGPEAALAAITRDAAALLGIAGRVGTLEVGKDGDLALFDGDPFETVTHCVGTVIEGVVESEERR